MAPRPSNRNEPSGFLARQKRIDPVYGFWTDAYWNRIYRSLRSSLKGPAIRNDLLSRNSVFAAHACDPYCYTLKRCLSLIAGANHQNGRQLGPQVANLPPVLGVKSARC